MLSPANHAFNLRRTFSRSSRRIVAIAAVLAGLISSAQAAPLLPGSAILSTNAPGTTGLTIVANTGPIPFASATFTGTLSTQVLVSDPLSPFGPGHYTFVYQLSCTAGPNSIDRMTVNGYGLPGLATDASYQTGTGTVPTSFDRSSAAALGDVIGESFTAAPLGLGVLPPGATSALWVVHTNSQQFNQSFASVIDGTTSSVATYAPVPEPSIAMAGVASLGLLLRRRAH
jgi:hypothetical protein